MARTPAHPIEPLFHERWSPRAFDGSAVCDADLMSLFEAARWAPSSFNAQPWRFLYAHRDTPDWDRMLGVLVPFNQVWARDAGVLILALSETVTTGSDGLPRTSHSHSFDTGAAWAQLALQAHRLGLITHGMTGVDFDAARATFAVPERFRIEAAIAVGRPGDKASLPEPLQAREVPSDRMSVAAFAFAGDFPLGMNGMTVQKQLSDARVLASPNRFKLAVFGANAQGVDHHHRAGRVDTDWPSQVRIAQLAEAAGIEAILPGARWKGYGGAHNFQGRSFETLAWAAGLAAVTTRAQVFATVHFTTIHPIRLAKTIATIDHISGGRFRVNWVAGWNAPEAAMFGHDQRAHDDRYAYADDYLALLDRIFAATDEFDYRSDYFDLTGIASDPKPIQAPRPVYMGAGLSPRGREFAAGRCDINFTSTQAGPDGIRGTVAETKAMARAKGRDVKVFGQATIFCADSEAEARDYFDYVVVEKGDYEAAGNLVRMLFADTRDVGGAQRGAMPEAIRQKVLRAMVAGHGGSILIGTPTQVVEQMAALADAGLDGTTLTWVDYEAGLVQLKDKIVPLMIDAGLRVNEPT